MSARKAVAGNVVPIRKPVLTPAEIEAEVIGRKRQHDAEMLAQLKSIRSLVSEQFERRVQEALPLGRRMTRATLDAWINMGQRLLANGGGR